jgi:hypothetical protein
MKHKILRKDLKHVLASIKKVCEYRILKCIFHVLSKKNILLLFIKNILSTTKKKKETKEEERRRH